LPSKKLREFEIECGEHRGVLAAKTIGAAWRRLTFQKKYGFGLLARFRELNTGSRSVWRYARPEWFDAQK